MSPDSDPACPVLIYLDNNATTACAPEVVEAMIPWLGHHYGNPSSAHRAGAHAARAVYQAREQVARLFNASPTEVVFTSGGTEANALAIFGTLATRPEHTQLITSKIEHPAVLEAMRALARQGYELVELPVDCAGCVDLAALDAALDPAKTALVSIMWANNETGTVQPIADIAARCAAVGVPFHSDAVQAAGKVPIDLADYPGLTLVSLAGHKIHGPKGIGALIVRSGTRLEPFTFGGHQEQGLRPGTENVPGIVGLGAAAVAASKCLASQVERIAALRDRFEQAVINTIPDVSRNGDPSSRTANTANLCFHGIPASAALLMLDQAGIACSAGSACCAGQTTASHVLKSMGLCDADGRASLRFSLSRYTTAEEIDAAIAALQRIIPELRSMSGYKNDAAVARYRAAQPVAE